MAKGRGHNRRTARKTRARAVERSAGSVAALAVATPRPRPSRRVAVSTRRGGRSAERSAPGPPTTAADKPPHCRSIRREPCPARPLRRGAADDTDGRGGRGHALGSDGPAARRHARRGRGGGAGSPGHRGAPPARSRYRRRYGDAGDGSGARSAAAGVALRRTTGRRRPARGAGSRRHCLVPRPRPRSRRRSDRSPDLAAAMGEALALLRPNAAARGAARLDPAALAAYEGYGAETDEQVVPLDITAAPARGGLPGLPSGAFLTDDGQPLAPLLNDLRDYAVGLWPYDYFGLDTLTSTPAAGSARADGRARPPLRAGTPARRGAGAGRRNGRGGPRGRGPAPGVDRRGNGLVSHGAPDLA